MTKDIKSSLGPAPARLKTGSSAIAPNKQIAIEALITGKTKAIIATLHEEISQWQTTCVIYEQETSDKPCAKRTHSELPYTRILFRRSGCTAGLEANWLAAA